MRVSRLKGRSELFWCFRKMFWSWSNFWVEQSPGRLNTICPNCARTIRKGKYVKPERKWGWNRHCFRSRKIGWIVWYKCEQTSIYPIISLPTLLCMKLSCNELLEPIIHTHTPFTLSLIPRGNLKSVVVFLLVLVTRENTCSPPYSWSDKDLNPPDILYGDHGFL